MNVIGIILMMGGLVFLAVGSLGVVRMPDFFTRAHAVGKADTLGGILLLGGMAVYHGFELSSLKLVLILLFVAIANPTSAHALTRAALRSGCIPWMKEDTGHSPSADTAHRSSDGEAHRSANDEAHRPSAGETPEGGPA